MSISIQKIGPQDIEAESFRIIEEELGSHEFDPQTFKIVQRVIHATGDFNFAENLKFSAEAISHGIRALLQGKNILTDVNMVATGINKTLLGKWGGKVICKIADDDVSQIAKKNNKTRAEVAIDVAMEENIGIVAIGNAPTALLKIIDYLKAHQPGKQPLIVGVPVGFVNAAESKALLHTTSHHYITSLGRKGGSPVAAAIVNALMKIADQQ